jgi:hypothetical protein
MFLRKLALSVKRLDFWNLEEEFSPYELAQHYVAEQIEPLGPERDDLRAAIQTILLIQSQSVKPLTSDQIDAVLSRFFDYLPVHKQEGRQVTPEEAAQLGKAAFARIGK